MTLIFWIIGGLCISVALIALAVVRVGSDHDNQDPYNGDGW